MTVHPRLTSAIAAVCCALLVLCVTPGAVRGDVVRLNDGTSVEGDVKKVPGGWSVTLADGSVRTLRSTDVKSIELQRQTRATTQAADERLYSLRRSVESLDDIPAIIDRYQRFIAQHSGTPSASEAGRDLQQWKQRLAQGLVRLGDKWVTPQEKQSIELRALEMSSDARRLVKDARFKEADKLLSQVLSIDPTNPSALYLRGLIAYLQDHAPEARKAFEGVIDLLPHHAPTLNNLAIVLWRQNQHAAALNRYDEAMLASPGDKEILDNVAEALHDLPRSIARGQIAARVTKRFNEQDAELQERMKQYGLFRLGATWVDADRLAKYREAEKTVMEQLNRMAADYDVVQGRIDQINGTLKEIEADWQKARDGTYFISRPDRPALADVNADYVVARLQELDRRKDELIAARDTEIARLNAIRAAARAVERQLPAIPYGGQQKLIGPEGTPIIPPDLGPRALPDTTAPAP